MSHVELDGLVIVLYEGVGVPEAVARLGFHGDVTDLSRHLQCVSACVGGEGETRGVNFIDCTIDTSWLLPYPRS